MRIVRICIDANSENRVCYLGAFAATSTVQSIVHADTHTYSGLGTQYETLRNELEIEINDTYMQIVEFYRCFMFKTDLLFNQSGCALLFFCFHSVGVLCFTLFLTRLQLAKKRAFFVIETTAKKLR